MPGVLRKPMRPPIEDRGDLAFAYDFGAAARLDSAVVAGASLVFARASTATYVDGTGTLRTAAAGAPRIDHDATGARLGVLVEPARANLLPYSEQIDTLQPGWQDAWGTLTRDAATVLGQPVGRVARARLAENQTAGGLTNGLSIGGATAGRPYAVSAWLGNTGGDTNAKYTLVERGGATSNATHRGAITIPAASQRVGAVFTLAQDDRTSLQIAIVNAGAGGGSYDYTAGLIQVEQGAWPSSYIPTTDGPTGRAADRMTAPLATRVQALAVRGVAGLGDGVAAQLDGGGNADRVRIDRAGGSLRCLVTVGGSDVATLDLGAVADRGAFAVGLSWSGGALVAARDGGAAVSVSLAAAPALHTLRVGHGADGEEFGGHVARLTAWRSGRPAAALQTATA